jgi:hypothetical protein
VLLKSLTAWETARSPFEGIEMGPSPEAAAPPLINQRSQAKQCAPLARYLIVADESAALKGKRSSGAKVSRAKKCAARISCAT